MAADGGAPATQRLISERLRGLLSGSVFMRSGDYFFCHVTGGVWVAQEGNESSSSRSLLPS
jgi:hypothetical protein